MKTSHLFFKYFLCSFTIFLFESCSIFGNKEPYISINQRLIVSVKDKNTAENIEGATVDIYDGSEKKQDGKTKKNGIYRSEPLKDGKYLISTSAINYKKKTENVEIKNGDSTLRDIDLELENYLSFDISSPLNFNADVTNKEVKITNIGNCKTLKVSISCNASWLKVTPTDVQIEEKGFVTMKITPDPRGLEVTKYSTTINVAYSSPECINVKGTISYNVEMNVITPPSTASPIITNFLPQEGKHGIPITILGQNFETDTSKVQVLFGGNRKAIITLASPTEYRVRVPIGAQAGPIVMRIGQTSYPSKTDFTYKLTCEVNTIASQSYEFYINDITTAADGSIYLAGFTSNGDKSGIFRYPMGANTPTTIINREVGFTNSQMIRPTKVVAVGNDLYIVDNYDYPRIKVPNNTQGYASIRKLSLTNNMLSTPYYKPISDKAAINDFVNIPRSDFNGLLFADGERFNKLRFDNNNVESLSEYEGLTVAMDFDGTNLYTLDLDSPTKPTRWYLRRRPISNLVNPVIVAERPLGISIDTPNIPEGHNYPKGVAIDPINQYAYVFDRFFRNNVLGYTIYQISLTEPDPQKRVEVLYNASASTMQGGEIKSDGTGGNFVSVSCLTYDPVQKAVLVVDVDVKNGGQNRVREIVCK